MYKTIKIQLFSVLFLLTLNVLSQIEVTRIDPPFWWTGMKETGLRLMVYGKKIGQVQPVLSYPGVKIISYTSLENPDYLIIDLDISEKAKAGKVAISFQYQRELLFVYEYELRSREEGSAERKGFGKEDVIYLVMPDRFSNGDPGNDSITEMLEGADRLNPNGRHGGDLKGIGDKLDYIAGLGVTAIWLNPVLENNMAAYSYHGYAITDFYRVDPRLGTNEEYCKLAGDCHQKGLKIIMDMVFNHCGSNHFWIKDLPSADWIHQFPEFTKSNFRAETVMDPYASDYDREKMLTGWFDKPMPDLNQHNKYLADYLIQNSIWWIEYAGLDGIRLDTYPYSYKDFMMKWMSRIREEYPNFSVLGETWMQKETHTAYWQNGAPAEYDFNSNLTYVTDFPMYFAIKDAFTEQEGWTTGLARLYYVLSQDFVYEDPFCNVIFADNHDLTRLFSSLGQDLNKFKMAMAFLLTTRGVPMIYYGTEYLMTGEEPKGHGYIRQDFPGGEWGGTVGGQRSAVGGQEEGVEYVRKLLNWRKTSDVIHAGKLKQFVPDDGFYVYFRYDLVNTVMVIINKNKDSRQLELKRFKEGIKGFISGTDVISGRTYILSDRINVSAETALILELVH